MKSAKSISAMVTSVVGERIRRGGTEVPHGFTSLLRGWVRDLEREEGEPRHDREAAFKPVLDRIRHDSKGSGLDNLAPPWHNHIVLDWYYPDFSHGFSNNPETCQRTVVHPVQIAFGTFLSRSSKAAGNRLQPGVL